MNPTKTEAPTHIDPRQAKMLYKVGHIGALPMSNAPGKGIVKKRQVGYDGALHSLWTIPKQDAMGQELPQPSPEEQVAHLDAGLEEIRKQGILPLSPAFVKGFRRFQENLLKPPETPTNQR